MSASLFDPDIAFDIVYSQFGGRWNPSPDDEGFQIPFLRYVSSIPAALIGAASKLHSSAPDAGRVCIPPMTFGLLNSQTLNCFASRVGENYYVGVSAMVPVALLELSAYFLSNELFFPEIGEPTRGSVVQLDGVEETPFFQIAENRFRPLISKALPDTEASSLARTIAFVRGNAAQFDSEKGRRLGASQYLLQLHTVVDMLLPICPVRRLHTEYLAALICHFFWFHEMAHVTQGHLRTLQRVHELPRIRLFEFPDPIYADYGSGSVRIENPLLLSLELDADIEATLMTLGIILQDIDIESDDEPYVNGYERVGLFVFMLIAVFGAIARKGDRRGPLSSTSHPTARVRLMNIVSYLANFSSPDEKLDAAVQSGLQTARSAGRYGKTDFLLGIGSAAESDFTELERIGKLRQTEMVSAYDTYGYTNLRMLVPELLHIIGPFIRPPPSPAS